MLFKRYGNPSALLATYSLNGLVDFVLYLLKKEAEDTLWEAWITGERTESFKKLKEKNGLGSSRKLVRPINEQANIDFAAQYISIREEESDGSI